MTWQLLLAGYLLIGTAAYLLRRSLAQSLPGYNTLINGFFFLGVLYPIGLIVAVFSSPNLKIGWVNFLLLAAGSGIFPIINIFAFRANKDVDAGLYTILNNLTPIVTIIAASVLLSERLNNQQLLGAAIIIVSTFLATVPRLRDRAASRTSGLAFGLAGVGLLGLAIVYERYMLTRIDYGAYLVFGWGAQTFWMVVLAWKDRAKISTIKFRKNLKPVIGYGLTNALKGLCFVSALKLSENASLVSAFSSFMAVLVVLSAYFVLKEKEWLWFKIAAAIIGATGLVILNAG